MIGRTTLEELIHVGTGVVWIGPAVKLLQKIWEQITAFEVITEELAKFADTLYYLTDTVDFIADKSLYHTNKMKDRMKGLVKLLTSAECLFKDVKEQGNNNVKKFFSAKHNQDRLKEKEEELTKWISRIYFIQLAENQELTLKLQTDLSKNQALLAGLKTQQQDILNVLNDFMTGK
jgi:hypothetical protein